MRILLTGAAGFIGSAVAAALAERKFQVTAIDSLSDYYSRELKVLRCDNFLNHPLIDFKELDLFSLDKVSQLFKYDRYDVVLHLAAQPGVRVPIKNWKKYIDDNLVSFSNILVASALNGVPKFMYASSSSVYGNVKSERLSESENILEPLSFYGATKLSNEVLAKSVSLSSGIKTRGLRFFTVYGPWGRPDMVYFRIICSALTNKKVVIYGDGSVERDFTYIDDVASMTIELIKQLDQTESGFSDIVNIGGGNPKSVNQVFEIVESIAGTKISLDRMENDPNDVLRTNADYTYLRSLIGTYPKINAKEGLSKTFDWARNDSVQKKLTKWVESVL